MAVTADPVEISTLNLHAEIARLLAESGLTIATAESCSGGLIAKYLTDRPGSSDYFLLGVVSYANNAKERVLSVDRTLLERHGAVSREVAAAMAEGVKSLAKSDIAVSTTGIAGPGGGSVEKPVGTVYIGIADNRGTRVFCHHFSGGREMVREATAEAALNAVLESLKSS